MNNPQSPETIEGIAIIGLAGRFPSARTLDQFWENLKNGVEAVSFFTELELAAEGVERAVLADPNYVRAKAVLEEIDLFDAGFFGINPKEAELMDPQQRIFLECAWEALERAGYDAAQFDGAIGLYAGASINSYLMLNLFSNDGLLDSIGILQASIPNRTDHLTTRAAYKLNLKGPGVTVQTACSTSLVALHLACQSLLNGESDIALAGGVTVSVPRKSGYLYQEGGVLSADGHCRAFAEGATGTVVGNGAGVVVLKRLAEALADGDVIHAVVKGSAINNDGSLKVGYTAPSVKGQSEVIAMAQAVAAVEPETISYIEAHGTGTTLGDPIEIEALTQVFRSGTDKRQFCAVGSVKTNIGHLDAAAGIAGLIKTTFALKHKMLPPSLHFRQPNPQINFADTPFYVNDRLAEWKADGTPRRAGVSSFGIGGTNAHVILEEAPERESSGESRPSQLLLLSAKTGAALEAATANLSEHLKQHQSLNLADVAYTLKVGRKAFNHRRSLVCHDAEDAARALDSLDPRRVSTGLHEPKHRPMIFMFPGQGSQYVRMGQGLYEVEPTFRGEVDRCAEFLKSHLELDLRQVLYPREERLAESQAQLKQTALTQPALFVIEYALARLWMEWGVRPQAMIGHSIGEYVAACLAGVMSLEDALELVAVRGRLMNQVASGEMLAVQLPEKDVRPLLGEALSLAAVNAPSLCVLAGTAEAISEAEARLGSQDVMSRRLHTSHAFHSAMMEAILEPFKREVERIALKPPTIAFASNLTGTWITAAEATDPAYWASHLRQTVRFGEGLTQLFKEPDSILLEVGPGRTLMTIARWHPSKAPGQMVLTSLPHPEEQGTDAAFLQNSLGRLWLTGADVDWKGFYTHERRQRVTLPTYPFERQRYWIEAQKDSAHRIDRQSLRKKSDVADWFYVPSWKRSVPPLKVNMGKTADSFWLVLVDQCGLGSQLVERLEGMGQEVLTVMAGEKFGESAARVLTINPEQRSDYDALLTYLKAHGKRPTHILHLWNVTPEIDAEGDLESSEKIQRLGFQSLMTLAQALGEQNIIDDLHLTVVTNNMQHVTGEESLCPEKATVAGPCKVIPQEYPQIACRSLDLMLPPTGTENEKRLLELLIGELLTESPETVVAYRHNQRWTQSFESHRLEQPPATTHPRLRPNGVYLITGGLGGIGLVLAEHLARVVQARLVLVGRSTLPARDEWQDWLATHDEQDIVSRKIKKVRELETLGGEVLSVSADVADLWQMERVLSAARERFGVVNGVIHAAGVPGGGMIQLKTQEKAASILSPKVRGARVLGDLFKDTELDFMLLCSSRSSILGGFGQVDYCAANAFLDAFAHYYSAKHNTFTVAVDWDGWQEVGMLVNTAAQYGVGGKPEAEARKTSHPLLHRCLVETHEQETYLTKFSVAEQWILEEHRIGGTAVLPGVTYLEMARAAFEKHADGGPIEMRDVYFISPMSIRDDEKREVRFTLERNGEGFRFHASSRLLTENGAAAKWQDHVIGEIGRAPSEPVKKHDLDEIMRRCNICEAVIDENERDPDLGPRWQNIKRAHIGDGEILVLFELASEFTSDLEKLKLHPSLLDRAAGTGMLYLELDGVYLPMSYKRLNFKQPLPRKIYAHIKQTETNYSKQETVTFDVVIMDESGIELVEIEEFSEKRINDLTGQIKAMAEGVSRAINVSEVGQAGQKSFYQESLNEGISPPEGVDAFTRILAGATLPQVVVSTKDLAASIAQANAFTQERLSQEVEKLQVERPLHPRPDIKTAYVEPRNSAEQTLAGIMQEMLGVERVGIHDNFFELGGDSVLSIQIIARANRVGIQITPQQIFQHQTIAELAAVAVQGEIGETLPQATRQDEAEKITRPAFELTGLGTRKLNKLTQLLDDSDEMEEEDEAEELVETGERASAQERNGVGEFETVLRQHPAIREAVVVAHGDNASAEHGLVAYVVLNGDQGAARQTKKMEYSLFYFAADNSQSGEDKYRLYLEGAKFADRHDFAAIWTPERHFHESGGLYPSPSVLSASLATITERIQLRAGSVVMPLHHSIRVAEEWSIIDNLSKGRVGVSFTSGWIPNDFAFFPQRYPNKREEMLRGIEEVRRLWRGQTIAARDGAGKDVDLRILPRPLQPELPVWLTCSGDPQMFVKAGELGFNVLTALLSQSIEDVAGKIALYRQARARHGHDPAAGNVTLMMHTFVGSDDDRVVAQVRAPLSDYLKAHVGLIETMTKSLDIKVDIEKEQYLDYLVAFAFERYYQTASLIGTPQKCLQTINQLKQIGVDEVACFIDFGVGVDAVLHSLRDLNELKELSNASSAAPPQSTAADSLTRSLKQYVQERLAQPLKSVSFVMLDALPLTSSGQVNYGALPLPGALRLEQENSMQSSA